MNENMGSLCCVLTYTFDHHNLWTLLPLWVKREKSFFAWKKVLRCIEPTQVASNTEWKAMGEWASLLLEAIYLTNRSEAHAPHSASRFQIIITRTTNFKWSVNQQNMHNFFLRVLLHMLLLYSYLVGAPSPYGI